MAKTKIPEFPPGSLQPVDPFAEYFRLIVHLIVGWNELEFLIASVLAIEMGVPENRVLGMIYALNNSQARLDTVEAGFTPFLDGHPRQTRIESLLRQARILVKLRNTYAHAQYAPSRDGKLIRTDWRQPGAKAARKVNISDLKIGAQQLNEAVNEAKQLLFDAIKARESNVPPAPDAASPPPHND